MTDFLVYLSKPLNITSLSIYILICFSAVSKNLSFTEESLVITQMTEKGVAMEAVTTQIKDADSVECTVEIVVHYNFFFQCEKHEFEKQIILQVKIIHLIFRRK